MCHETGQHHMFQSGLINQVAQISPATGIGYILCQNRLAVARGDFVHDLGIRTFGIKQTLSVMLDMAQGAVLRAPMGDQSSNIVQCLFKP